MTDRPRATGPSPRKVSPHLQRQLASPRRSHEWAVEDRGQLFGRASHAILSAITAPVEENEADDAAAAAEAPAAEQDGFDATEEATA